MHPVIVQTDIVGLKLHARGKVRDIYELGEDLLLVASDRISAFDYVLASGIPDKGRVLTQLSLFWFRLLSPIVANHVITARVEDYPQQLQKYAEELEGRSMIVRRAEMVPIECVVRGYISGSAWKEYLETGSVCGIQLPAGLRESAKLPQPIFSPASKNTSGHDVNIPFSQMVQETGLELSEQLRDISLRLYDRAAAHALERGIILADTKFEFGKIDGEIVLADEVFTPDSSRFWPAETYAPGKAQLSFDKQYVRDYLESIRWNKLPPAPSLPDDVANRTSEKYKQAFRQLTGFELDSREFMMAGG